MGINYAWPVTTLDRFDYDALKSCVDNNRDILDSKKIVIFGAGIRGTGFSLLLKSFGYSEMVFTDNNAEKIGGFINEFPIIAYSEVEKDRDNVVVIISVEGGLSLKEQLEESGFVEGTNYFYIDNHLYDRYVERFLDKKEAETILFGDCGITDVSKLDSDFRNVGELFTEKMGDRSVKVLAIHAMGMRAFYHILCSHVQNVGIPKNILLMANFETFTGKQHLLPRSQHALLIEMLNKAIDYNNDGLKEYGEVTKERFSNFKTDYFTTSNQRDAMSREKNDRIVMMMNYMYTLKRDNECLVYMKKVVELCKEKGINVRFFIPPANYMYGEKLLGEKFMVKYKANIEDLEDYVTEIGSHVYDLSFILKSSEFAAMTTIDETCNFAGRNKVADELVKIVNEMN